MKGVPGGEPTVTLQYDGSTSHTDHRNIAKYERACTSDGWNIRINVQPSNSPDYA